MQECEILKEKLDLRSNKLHVFINSHKYKLLEDKEVWCLSNKWFNNHVLLLSKVYCLVNLIIILLTLEKKQ